jgi:mono/diheme cytochrome c family protein
MPTAWLASLEAGPFSREPLLSAASMRRFGFIVEGSENDRPDLNPYGMPLGLASTGTRVPVDPGNPADTRTVDATGFTCAACHTGQLEYEGKLLRVEGGQAYHDARAFQDALAKSVVATWLLPSKYARFRAKAVERGFPEDKIDARFETAFDAAWGGIKARLKREPDLYPTYEGPGRLDALQRIANQLFAEDLKIRENNLTGEGPVSFPYLWDIWLFDWVQYNGSVRQPMVRNVGEALGVNARTNLVDANGRPNPDPERWRSTVRVRDIHAVETAYETLGPPRWPAEDVLPPVDRAKAAEGRRLFVERCAGCHAVKMITDRPVTRPRDGAKVFEWHVPVIPLAAIGTDPVAATSFARNRYDASKLGVAEPIGAAEGLSSWPAR